MKILKKLLDIPIPYAVIFGVITTALIVLTAQGELTPLTTAGLAVLTLLFGLQMYLGSVVIKSVLAAVVVIYSAAIYTSAVMSLHGNIVEPFLLTIGSATLFLSQTYDKNKLYYGMRSRALWSSVITFSLVALKLAFILSGYSFMITELIGANLLILFIALWRLWLHHSSKTSLVEPEIKSVEDVESFRFIYIETKLNSENKKWLNGKLKKKENNAYPYIYNEVLKANEKGLHVVFVYTVSSNNIYDIGEIKTNKANKVAYLYVESKDGEHMQKALEDFSEEISRS